MKQFVPVLLLFFVLHSVKAQDAGPYKLSSINDKFGVALLEVADAYLSPLIYTGTGLRYEHVSTKFLLDKSDLFSITGKFNVLAGLTTNPEITNSMTYVGASYKWGVNYHYDFSDVMDVFAGVNAGAEFGLKNNSRNVNNPVNMDISTGLNLSGLLRYKIETRRRVIVVDYYLETPFIGCMFVPESGASYYEMGELGHLGDAVHFSSLHNKVGMTTELNVQVPFQRSEWIFGVGSSVQKYKANGLLFKTASYYLNIGIRYDISVFKGLKNQAPLNFRSVEL